MASICRAKVVLAVATHEAEDFLVDATSADFGIQGSSVPMQQILMEAAKVVVELLPHSYLRLETKLVQPSIRSIARPNFAK